jgi:protocatechuate 3,4-dioxygenase alpha subunit
VRLRGRPLDGAGNPIDGLIELWDAGNERWGRSGTDGAGRFEFTVAKPASVNGEAPHFEVYVFARGLLKHQLTRVYFPDDPDANEADPVLSSLGRDERATLVAEQEDGSLRFEIRMQGDRATVFFAV